MHEALDVVRAWLEGNATLLGALASVAAVVALFLTNGTQLIRRKFGSANSASPVPPANPGTGPGAGNAAEVPKPVLDRPSIAVLPFTNMSSNADHEYLADGLTEDIITQLSRITGFFVIARNSTFAYKGLSPDIRQVGRELGVRFVVEGSVRVIGQRMRVTVQLIESDGGTHLWAENVDRPLDELFELQDELTRGIVSSIQPQVLRAEAARVRSKPPESLEAWELVHQAFGRMLSGFGGSEKPTDSIELGRRAIKLDPGYARAHAVLAWALANNSLDLHNKNSEHDELAEALEHGARAVALDRDDPMVLYCWSVALLYSRRTTEGIDALERAVALDPNDAQALAFLGNALNFTDRYDEGIAKINQAMRLSPRDPRSYLWCNYLAMAYMDMEQHAEAASWGKKCVAQNAQYVWGWFVIARSQHILGNQQESQAALVQVRRLWPEFSLKNYEARARMRSEPEDLITDRMELLREMGVE